MVRKYFLPFHRLPFHFADSIYPTSAKCPHCTKHRVFAWPTLRPSWHSPKRICFSHTVKEERNEPAIGGRAEGGLLQTPRPSIKIRVYLRTGFLTQALSQPRQTQVMLIPCFLGSGVTLCSTGSVTLRLRMWDTCLALSVLSVGGSGRGVIPFPPESLGMILSPVNVLLKCIHLSKLNG